MEGCIAKTGDIYQMCAVVSDLDKIMRNWVKYIDFNTDSIKCYPADWSDEGYEVKGLYKGAQTSYRVKAVRFDFATIEMLLVEPVNKEGGDPYSDFLKTHGNNYHHVTVEVSNMEEAVEKFKEEGYLPLAQTEAEDGCHVMYDFREQFGLIVDFTKGKTGPMARTEKPVYEPVDISRWAPEEPAERKMKFDLTMQVAMVTRDVYKAAKFLQTLVDGGEVFVDAEASEAIKAGEMILKYKGVPDAYEYKEQHMFWGRQDIEWFSPISDQSPNPMGDWLKEQGPGFQHMDMWLLDRFECEKYMRETLGWEAMEEVIRGERICTYMDLREQLGLILELGPRIVGPRSQIDPEELELMRG